MSVLFRPLLVAGALALSAFTVPSQRAATISLVNESSHTVVFLYASTCEEDTWSDDLLPVDVLEPGSGAEITLDAGCWDLRAVTDAEHEIEYYGVEVSDGDELEWVIVDEE
jgi:hypothetical protein